MVVYSIAVAAVVPTGVVETAAAIAPAAPPRSDAVTMMPMRCLRMVFMSYLPLR